MDEGSNFKNRQEYTYDYYDYPIVEECANYSLLGIIQFLQNEWTKIEIKTVQWEVERTELQAKIAYLQGERKCQENLKSDLLRRIKMLEYALKQERGKLNSITRNCESSGKNVTIEETQNDEEKVDFDDADIYLELCKNNQKINDENTKWKDEKNRLKKMILDMNESDDLKPTEMDSDENEDSKKEQFRKKNKNDEPKSSASFIDSNFKFLSNDNDNNKGKYVDSEEYGCMRSDFVYDEETKEALAEFDNLVNQIQQKKYNFNVRKSVGPNDENEWSKVDQSVITKMKELYIQERAGTKSGSRSKASSQSEEKHLIYDVVDSGTTSESDSSTYSADESDEWVVNNAKIHDDFGVRETVQLYLNNGEEKGHRSPCVAIGKQNTQKGHLMVDLNLGDLASLSVTNEAGVIISDPDNSALQSQSENSVDISISEKSIVKKTWTARFTLRSHFDSIRAIMFHPIQPLLVTASEDATLKLWNLTKTIPSKKGSVGLDVEPVYTYRGHKSHILCICLQDKLIFSGSLDGEIKIWKIPNAPVDSYDSFDTSIQLSVYFHHEDAVWSLCCPKINQLLSASADGTVKLWNVDTAILTDIHNNGQHQCLLNTFRFPNNEIPTCLSSTGTSDIFAISFTNGSSGIADIKTGSIHCIFEIGQSLESEESETSFIITRANCLTTHPHKPMTVVGYDDCHIRCFDNNSGEMIYSTLAHQSPVSSLAIDATGCLLLSASHDTSIRIWNMNNWLCLQEITCHRKKVDETIHHVAFHQSKNLFASAGADGLAKVFI